ncbi:NARE ribosyltransferase, partial [Zapornia atra]|nr:NARE ribosyltransferase [Zapornia atra]
MDMAPNSFDDQYEGCRKAMEAKLNELNCTEFETKTKYSKAWKEATAKLLSRGSELSMQAIALMAYTLPEPSLHKDFNEAVHEAGSSRNQYLRNFPYKVMHFLLTKAVQDLGEANGHQCYDVYRGVKESFTAQVGETVRFGYFASSSLNRTRAEMYGNHTIFSVHTCCGAPIWDYALSKDHKEVLIPPFETFKVMNVSQEGKRCIIKLHAQAKHSNYSCEFVKGDVL